MTEDSLDIWTQLGIADAICFTSNGFVKRNGEAVMGRGIAAAVAKRWPQAPKWLGEQILRHGNCTQFLCGHFEPGRDVHTTLVAFPVKPSTLAAWTDEDLVPHMRGRVLPGTPAPGWACLADPLIIRRSCLQLLDITNNMGWKRIMLTRPGCYNGGLSWPDTVRPILTDILDDRFTVVTHPSEIHHG